MCAIMRPSSLRGCPSCVLHVCMFCVLCLCEWLCQASVRVGVVEALRFALAVFAFCLTHQPSHHPRLALDDMMQTTTELDSFVSWEPQRIHTA